MNLRKAEQASPYFKACRQTFILQSVQIPGMIRNEGMVSYLLFDCCCLLIVHLLITKNVICKGRARSFHLLWRVIVGWFAYGFRPFRKMGKHMKDCDRVVILNISFKENEFQLYCVVWIFFTNKSMSWDMFMINI